MSIGRLPGIEPFTVVADPEMDNFRIVDLKAYCELRATRMADSVGDHFFIEQPKIFPFLGFDRPHGKNLGENKIVPYRPALAQVGGVSTELREYTFEMIPLGMDRPDDVVQELENFGGTLIDERHKTGGTIREGVSGIPVNRTAEECDATEYCADFVVQIPRDAFPCQLYGKYLVHTICI